MQSCTERMCKLDDFAAHYLGTILTMCWRGAYIPSEERAPYCYILQLLCYGFGDLPNSEIKQLS